MDTETNEITTPQQTIKFKPSVKVQMAEKSPIAQLHEMLVKKKKFPNFELVEKPIFKYRVCCDDISGKLEGRYLYFRSNDVKN